MKNRLKTFEARFAEQIKVGFRNQRKDYFTAREAARTYGHGYYFYLGELEYQGYLERRLHGRRQSPVLRITEKGKEFGQEVMRNENAKEPYSFRWKGSLIRNLLKILSTDKGR